MYYFHSEIELLAAASYSALLPSLSNFHSSFTTFYEVQSRGQHFQHNERRGTFSFTESTVNSLEPRKVIFKYTSAIRWYWWGSRLLHARAHKQRVFVSLWSEICRCRAQFSIVNSSELMLLLSQKFWIENSGRGCVASDSDPQLNYNSNPIGNFYTKF